jgi:serpin B
VNDKAAGRIPTIVDQIEPDKVMFLVNAIYFKGSWRTAFDRGATKMDSFTDSAPIPLTMRCDRPYLIVIRERLSGTIVFIGKINTI